ncbi:helix-turn-helix domain-containing protein [Amycolatopsis cihanbeyliensis]|uniref:Helix-turn-helix protein n=1 Tax=Amycolatopsis cihanbeyliensis TaxID=1128664 RepID=A0A542DH94_AMYCI|nr:helix-turn-helix transcriptional regulator [Amycolatopsis cihanbeyliensis]TQJ02410.1 helix-turn-helix protein [Amycolatopsis cihanbeyliensis]
MTDFETRRKEFGAKLRRLREHHAASGRDVANELGWPQSKVSKLETGKQTPDDSDVIEWCTLLDASEARDDLLAELAELRVQQIEWRRQLRAGHRDKQTQLDQRQQRATRIRAVDITSVTGLVQTPDYARRIFRTQADLLEIPHDTEAAVKARMKRQQILYDTDKQIEILISEAALAHMITMPTELIVQLDRLATLIGMPHVRLGILPLYRQLPHVPVHGYWIVDDYVTIENITAEVEIDDPEQVALYHRLTGRLWTAAADGDDARTVLSRAAEQLAG